MVLVGKLRARWLAVLVHAAALTSLSLLVWDYWQGNFLIDPVQEIMPRTGRTALILLLLSLAGTPLNTLFRFKKAMQVRRPLGLYAFAHAALHVLTFIGLDYGFDLELIIEAIFGQSFALVGLAAFILLLLLAITSTKGWQKRLRRNWKRLHRLVYLLVPLVILHFAWAGKDFRDPLLYAGGMVLLLVLRVPRLKKAVGAIQFRARMG